MIEIKYRFTPWQNPAHEIQHNLWVFVRTSKLCEPDRVTILGVGPADMADHPVYIARSITIVMCGQVVEVAVFTQSKEIIKPKKVKHM